MRGSWGIALLLAACGGSEFTSSSNGGTSGSGGSTGGSGGAGGSGASSAAGGIGGGGFGGSAGAPEGGSSGSATGGSGGSIPLDCDVLCTKQIAAGCAVTPLKDACVTGCTENLSFYFTKCPAETDALVQCYISPTGTVVCAADGAPELIGCGFALQQWGACAGCLVGPADSACESCEKTKCCSEIGAFYTSENAGAYSDCRAQCPIGTCTDACDAQYPVAAAALGSVFECRATQCGTSCP